MQNLLIGPLVGCLAVIFVGRPADALVMCGARRVDGSVREGASIKLRTTCKSNEVQLDPIGLGLQGPSGDPGPSGPEGPVGPTGVPGAGLVARDTNDALIGPRFVHNLSIDRCCLDRGDRGQPIGVGSGHADWVQMGRTG